MPIQNEEDLVRLLELHKHRAMEKLKKTNAFKNVGQYEAAWKNFVFHEMGKHFTGDTTQYMPLLNKLSEIEEQHKEEWIGQLQDYHNKKYWKNYIQDRKKQLGKDVDLPPK